MNKGVLLFAFNSPNYDYFKMAEYCAKRVNYFLNLPVTLVTDKASYKPSDYFDQVIFSEPNKTNLQKKEVWINKDRFKAYNYSPYDITLLLDVDYVVNGPTLLTGFDFVKDVCAHNTIQFINNMKHKQFFLSQYSHQLFWATVIFFRKSNKARQVFECMEMIQKNYAHYASLHNFIPTQFRNDFALTLALDIVNGHLFDKSDRLQWDLIHIGKSVQIDKLSNTEFRMNIDTHVKNKIRNDYILIKNFDFHVLDKVKYLELIDE